MDGEAISIPYYDIIVLTLLSTLTRDDEVEFEKLLWAVQIRVLLHYAQHGRHETLSGDIWFKCLAPLFILTPALSFSQLFLLGMVVGSQGVTLYEYFNPGVSGEGITSGLGTTHIKLLAIFVFSSLKLRQNLDLWV